MRRSRLPPQAEAIDPNFTSWARQNLETAARPVRAVELTFAAASTEYRIRHRLPILPEGFRVIDRDRAGQVWTSRKPDKFYLYLQADTASLKVTLEVF